MENLNLLPIENKAVSFAQSMADISGKPWEVFRDGKGAVDVGLAGTCATESKFRLLVVVSPNKRSHK